MDPFDERDKPFAEEVREIISEMNVGDKKQLDIESKHFSKFRSSLYFIQLRAGKKFKTKTDDEGGFWIKRIA